MTPYYHLNSARLALGSTILPGNWGRVIRRAGWAHNLALREIALEMTRAAKFPSMPSRLDCSFAFPTVDEAVLFWREERKRSPFDILYRVSLAEPSAAFLITDWTLVVPNGEVGTAWADRYWAGPVHIETGSESPVVGIVQVRREVLTMSPLVVEECLDLT